MTRVIQQVQTSTAPVRVATDAGEAFVKTMGNPQGSSSLVSEFVGTALAAWLGLPTFDTAVVNFPAELELEYPDGCRSLPGPAFASRAVRGRAWSGVADDLVTVENPEAMSGLVVFDTWTRNCDRYRVHGAETRLNIENVFFCAQGASTGKWRLLAMDHTECFRCGREFAVGMFGIDQVRDTNLFGLFPAFIPYVTPAQVKPFVERLGAFRATDAKEIMIKLPQAWGLREDLQERLLDFCVQRAAFLSERIIHVTDDACTVRAAPVATSAKNGDGGTN